MLSDLRNGRKEREREKEREKERDSHTTASRIFPSENGFFSLSLSLPSHLRHLT